MSLLVLGTVAFDTIETPFGKAERIIGGAGTYVAWAASHFCDDIKLVSIIGDDFPAAELVALQARGVDMAGLEIRKGEKSFFWAGRYHNNMNSRDTLVTELNVLADFNPLLPAAYTEVDYLMLGNFAPAVQMQVINQITRRPRLVVMDTMNFWMDIAMDELKKVIAKVDVIMVNDEEARQLSGQHALPTAAKAIHAMGPKTVVIKKGEHGALIFQNGEMFFAPAMPLATVFDPTGAGDSFAGGFMGYLAKTNDISFANMRRALIYGSVVASYCVEKFGPTRLQEIQPADIEARLQAFKNLMHVEF